VPFKGVRPLGGDSAIRLGSLQEFVTISGADFWASHEVEISDPKGYGL